MSVKEKKEQELLDFFRQNGFNNSIDDIALGLGVTTRTIFNRYKTVANIENEVLRIWRDELEKRLYTKFELCNHSIEKLLFIIHELKRCYFRENDFFTKTILKPSPDLQFLEKMMNDLILSEMKKGYFNEFTECESYTPFLIHNIIYYLTENPSIHIILYALQPILSERGYELLRDIDLDILL